jgi:hypothetical protein
MPAKTLLEIAFEIMYDAKFDGESESEVRISKNAFQYALRVANPWGANRPAGGWPPEERIVMTP